MNDFHCVLDLQGSDSLKWGRYAGRDILPMWVADMDFAAPPAVLSALHARVDHAVFGYAEPWPSLVEAVQSHLWQEYGWAIEPEWLVWLPGLVTGLNVACRAVAGSVLSATPVYPPFFSAPRHAGCDLATVALSSDDAGWHWDWSALAAAAPGRHLFLLCHPHNPVGRCWRDDELAQLADLAAEHDWVVCSDEIHCDLILEPGRRHRPFSTVSDDAAQRSITLMAPSKTFNVPALGAAFAVIPSPALRRRFVAAMNGIVPHVNVLGLVAAEAAYRDARDWRSELIDVLAANRDRLERAVEDLPGLRMAHVEATYLAWIDARGLGVSDPAAYFEAHGLGLSNGADFGAPGWVRLNFGCPPATLDIALARLAAACHTAG